MSGPVWPLRCSLYRGPAHGLSVVVLGLGGGAAPCGPGTCSSSARARAVLGAWLPPWLVQGGGSARPSLEDCSEWVSGLPFEMFSSWGGRPPLLLGSGRAKLASNVRPIAHPCGRWLWHPFRRLYPCSQGESEVERGVDLLHDRPGIDGGHVVHDGPLVLPDGDGWEGLVVVCEDSVLESPLFLGLG